VNGPSPTDIQITDDRFFDRVIQGGSLALGESYMDGWWKVHSLDGFIAKLIETSGETVLQPLATKLYILKAKIVNLQDRIRCRKVVTSHYDLDNNLYSKMLDPWMQYTCGYWEGVDNLNDAQEAKLEQICRKLQLKEGDHVLELGCGFGGLSKFMAERYGCRVTAYNISKEQIAWARNWTKNLPVEIIEKDYRDAQGTFDKAVAVGLCEHVGVKNYRTLMKVAHTCLRKGGFFLLNHVGGNESKAATDPWLEKYIFPGSVMPSIKQLAESFEGLFVMEDWGNFGLSYDKTCVAWFENFDRNWQQIQSTGYDDRFYRMWKYYLLLCAGSFRARKNQNWEMVLSKQ
jgi:cyclopropane-fatty-acyl-phospholipid synthase